MNKTPTKPEPVEGWDTLSISKQCGQMLVLGCLSKNDSKPSGNPTPPARKE